MPIRLYSDGPIQGDGAVTLRAEGIPGRDTVTFAGGLLNHWSGYQLDWEGYRVELDRLVPPCWVVSNELGVMALQITKVTASRPGDRMHAGITWSPSLGHHKLIEVVADEWGDEDLIAAGNGLRLLEGDLMSHRPEGTTAVETRDDYARLIWKNIYDKPERLRHLAGAKPSTVADWLGISESSIDRYRVRFGIGIRDIRRRRVRRPS